jgi:hypothetical protein
MMDASQVDEDILPDEEGRIIERLAQRIFDKLREGVFRLPPDAAGWLLPFGGFLCPPVQVGHGQHYCMLETRITREGGLHMMLRTPDGQTLWDGTLVP